MAIMSSSNGKITAGFITIKVADNGKMAKTEQHPIRISTNIDELDSSDKNSYYSHYQFKSACKVKLTEISKKNVRLKDVSCFS